ENKPVQPVGIGIAQSKYPEGWGINYYDGPHGPYKGVLSTAAEVLYYWAHWGDGDTWLDVGNNSWVKAEHFNFWPFKAVSKYPEGWGVNYYDGIDGQYKGTISSKAPFMIYARKEGWIDIGNNSWAPEKHFDILDIR
ncbi:lysozyme, partial [Bacillus cereus]